VSFREFFVCGIPLMSNEQCGKMTDNMSSGYGHLCSQGWKSIIPLFTVLFDVKLPFAVVFIYWRSQRNNGYIYYLIRWKTLSCVLFERICKWKWWSIGVNSINYYYIHIMTTTNIGEIPLPAVTVTHFVSTSLLLDSCTFHVWYYLSMSHSLSWTLTLEQLVIP
jgi:hypothetical protein